MAEVEPTTVVAAEAVEEEEEKEDKLRLSVVSPETRNRAATYSESEY